MSAKILNRLPITEQQVLIVYMFKCGCDVASLAQVFDTGKTNIENIIRDYMK